MPSPSKGPTIRIVANNGVDLTAPVGAWVVALIRLLPPTDLAQLFETVEKVLNPGVVIPPKDTVIKLP